MAMVAVIIGLRAKATTMPVPSSSVVVAVAAPGDDQQRIVSGLGRPRAVVAGEFEFARLGAHVVDFEMRDRRRPTWAKSKPLTRSDLSS